MLPGGGKSGGHSGVYASFGVVVAQILVLDAIFSLDSIITAVGMVEHLWVMMAAVTIAMAVFALSNKVAHGEFNTDFDHDGGYMYERWWMA